MAITQKGPSHTQKLPKSLQETIGFAFSTSDTTGTITTKLKRIRKASFSLFPSSNLAAAECLCIYGLTQDAEGFFVVPNNGQITVGRVGASVTSALAATVQLEGY